MSIVHRASKLITTGNSPKILSALIYWIWRQSWQETSIWIILRKALINIAWSRNWKIVNLSNLCLLHRAPSVILVWITYGATKQNGFIVNIKCPETCISDHLPLLAVCLYKHCSPDNTKDHKYITYQNLKSLDHAKLDVRPRGTPLSSLMKLVIL